MCNNHGYAVYFHKITPLFINATIINILSVLIKDASVFRCIMNMLFISTNDVSVYQCDNQEYDIHKNDASIYQCDSHEYAISLFINATVMNINWWLYLSNATVMNMIFLFIKWCLYLSNSTVMNMISLYLYATVMNINDAFIFQMRQSWYFFS